MTREEQLEYFKKAIIRTIEAELEPSPYNQIWPAGTWRTKCPRCGVGFANPNPIDEVDLALVKALPCADCGHWPLILEQCAQDNKE